MALTDAGVGQIRPDPPLRIETRFFLVIQTAAALVVEAVLLVLAYFKSKRDEKEGIGALNRELIAA